MARRDEIVRFAEALLNSREIEDPWCANGLQVEGSEEVKRIALGVSSSQYFLQAAADWEADMCVVHHGLFWKKGEIKILGLLKNRLQILLSNNISLVNFHIPLDSHSEIGNNAVLVEKLGLVNPEPVECGFVAEFPEAISFSELLQKVQTITGRINFSEDVTKRPIKRIGVISGGAASFALAVKRAGADAFVFGEITEHDYHDLKEMDLSFLAAGHYATERYGVQRLGEKIKEKFADVEIKFFEEDCPV